MTETPVELIARALEALATPDGDFYVEDYLVPEQCLCLVIGDQLYHVEVTPITA